MLLLLFLLLWQQCSVAVKILISENFICIQDSGLLNILNILFHFFYLHMHLSVNKHHYFARASGSGRSIAIGLSVCLSHHVHNVLIVHNVHVLNLHPTNHAKVFRASSLASWQPGLATSCQLVANFCEFFHLHPWCQHDCGWSLLSTIALFILW